MSKGRVGPEHPLRSKEQAPLGNLHSNSHVLHFASCAEHAPLPSGHADVIKHRGSAIGTRFTCTGAPEDDSGLVDNPDEVQDAAICGVSRDAQHAHRSSFSPSPFFILTLLNFPLFLSLSRLEKNRLDPGQDGM